MLLVPGPHFEKQYSLAIMSESSDSSYTTFQVSDHQYHISLKSSSGKTLLGPITLHI